MLSSKVISFRQKCFLPQCDFFAAKIVFFLQSAKCFRAFLFFFLKKKGSSDISSDGTVKTPQAALSPNSGRCPKAVGRECRSAYLTSLKNI